MGRKSTLRTLQATNKRNFPHENLARKRKIEKEIESFQIAAQNIDIMNDYIKATTDKTQQNRKCWL